MNKLAMLAAVAAFSLPVTAMAQDAPGTVKKTAIVSSSCQRLFILGLTR